MHDKIVKTLNYNFIDYDAFVIGYCHPIDLTHGAIQVFEKKSKNYGKIVTLPLYNSSSIKPKVNNEYFIINILWIIRPELLCVRLHKGFVTKINENNVVVDNELNINNDIINYTNTNNSKKMIFRSSLFYDSKNSALMDWIILKPYFSSFMTSDSGNYTFQSNW